MRSHPHGRLALSAASRAGPAGLAYPSVRFLPLGQGDGRACLTAVSWGNQGIINTIPSFCTPPSAAAACQGSQTNKQSQEARGRGAAGPPGPAGRSPAHREPRGLGDTQGARAHTHWDSGRGRSGPDGLFPLTVLSEPQSPASDPPRDNSSLFMISEDDLPSSVVTTVTPPVLVY